MFLENLKNHKNEILKKINFQSPYIDLPKKMTVEQNLFYSRLYGVMYFKDVIDDLAKNLQMNDLLKKNYGSLSAGQKTKVNLCKALINTPKLLLLDEPTASLDPETSIFIRDFLVNYKRLHKSSIIITSHNLDEIQSICSEIILLKSGEIDSRTVILNFYYKKTSILHLKNFF